MACYTWWSLPLLDGFEWSIHVPSAFIPQQAWWVQVVKPAATVTECDQFTYWFYRIYKTSGRQNVYAAIKINTMVLRVMRSCSAGHVGGICGGRNGPETGTSPSTSVFPRECHPQTLTTHSFLTSVILSSQLTVLLNKHLKTETVLSGKSLPALWRNLMSSSVLGWFFLLPTHLG
jgi:hypothetical protein